MQLWEGVKWRIRQSVDEGRCPTRQGTDKFGWGHTLAKVKARGEKRHPGREGQGGKREATAGRGGTGESRLRQGYGAQGRGPTPDEATYDCVETPSMVCRICRAVVRASTVASTTWDARAF